VPDDLVHEILEAARWAPSSYNEQPWTFILAERTDTAEFAKMRAVMRASEKHREGGVDPELEDADADPGPDT
jgi:nitroreductase